MNIRYLPFLLLSYSLDCFAAYSPQLPEELKTHFQLGASKHVVYSKFLEMHSPLFGRGLDWENPFICNSDLDHREFNRTQTTEILRAPRGEIYFVFGAVTKPTDSQCKLVRGANHSKDIGNGSLISAHSSLEAARQVALSFWEYSVAEAEKQRSNKKKERRAPKNPADTDPPSRVTPKVDSEENETDEPMPASSGTGFFVSNAGHLLTNHHVVNGCEKTVIHFKGNSFDTVVVAVDRVNDLALLKSDIKQLEFATLGFERPELMEEIYVAGYPFGRQISSSMKVTRGIISALSGYGDDYANVQIDAAINRGNSGGPIVNQLGNAVAVAVSGLDKASLLRAQDYIPEGINFGIKGSIADLLLEAHHVEIQPTRKTELSSKQLGYLLSNSTAYISCLMSYSKIKSLRSEKVFFEQFNN